MIAKIMFLGDPITITTDADDPDTPVVPKFTGKRSNIEALRRTLEDKGGFYGHSLDMSQTTNLDLQHALTVSAPLVLIQSLDPEVNPSPIPDGAIP